MKKSRNSIPAFSMLEILVVMVLSSIGTGIIYSAYFFVSRYHGRLETRTSHNLMTQELYRRITKDLDEAWHVTRQDSSTIVVSGGRLPADVAYTFTSDTIVRVQGERKDFYAGNFSMPVCMFLKPDSLAAPLVRVLRFDIASFNPAMDFLYIKKYDAASILNAANSERL